MKKVSFLLLYLFAILRAESQTTSSFNFSRAPQSVAGWTNVYGDPAASAAPLTATASSGISISSIGSSNWAGYNGAGSSDAGGAAGGIFFPAAVMLNMWFQYSTFYGRYIAGTPQLEISGLKIDSVYTLKMTGSFTTNVPATFNLNPMRYTVSGASVYGYIDVNGNLNTSDGAVFHNIAPNASGKIQVYLSTVNGSNVAGISGLQITAERSTSPSPVVSIQQPSNNTLVLENSNVLISASAAETGGSIAKVEFYADSIKIGEDTVTPYSFTWNNALKGMHVLKARAIDGLGNASTASVNAIVQPLSAFWSTAGNTALNADSNFLGTTDSNRIAFRTKNVEKMSLSPAGVLRLNQYKNDALGNSILTTDTLGNLKLRGLTFGNGMTMSRDSVFIGGNINFGRYPSNSVYFNFLNPADTVSSALWEYNPSFGMRTVVNQMHGGNDGLNTNFYLAPTGITLVNQASSLASGTLKGGGAYMHLYGNNINGGNQIEQAVYDATGMSNYVISPQSMIWNSKKNTMCRLLQQ